MIGLSALVAPPAVAVASADSAAPSLDHRHQLGLTVLPGTGFRMIVRYNEEQICVDASATDSKWICTNDVPFYADLGLSFAVTSTIDLLVETRLGIARDDAAGIGRQLAFFPGIRYWLDSEGPFKFFTTLQAALDRTRQSQDAVKDRDFGIRNANGLMWDPNRHLGVYVQLGETMGFTRWFRLEIDVGVGVQGRY